MAVATQKKPLNLKEYITASQAVERFPIKLRTLRRWIAEGWVQTEFVRRGTGGRRFIKLSSLEKRFIPE
jgi:hypothetical protein